MKVIIVGAGRRGSRIAVELSKEDADIIFIDTNKTRLDNVLNKLDCMGFLGSGTDIDLLEKAGCKDADAFIAVTANDETNIVACGLVASQFHIEKTIAAIKNLGWIGKDGIKGMLLGISEIVNPNVVTANSIYNIVNNGIYNNVITFNDSDFILYNYKVTKGERAIEESVKNIREKSSYDYIIAAVYSKGKSEVPKGNTIIHEDDILSIVGKPKELAKLIPDVASSNNPSQKIILVGGSTITRFFLMLCTPRQLSNITLIDMDKDICLQFATEFPNIIVLNADITDDTILKDANLTHHDLLISLTDVDELNLITATYAKKIGIRRSISLIRQNINYLTMGEYLGIDSIISTTESTVETVISKLRGSNVSSIHSIFGGTINIYEYTIDKDTPVCNKKLSEVDMRGKGIIAAINTNGNKRIIPSGSYTLKEGDHVLVSVGGGKTKFIQQLFIKDGE